MRAKVTAAVTALGRWSLAHLAIRVEEYLFDYVLYPFMLYRGGESLLASLMRLAGAKISPSPVAGYWVGLCLLTVASVGINLFYISAYDRLRTDWFGFETLKEVNKRLTPVASRRWRPWRIAARYGAFAYLSIWHSPLFGTLFMRGSAEAYAMNARDWRIFWAALLIANLGWAGMVSGVVEAARMVLPYLRWPG